MIMEFKGTKGKWYQSHRVIPESKKRIYSTQVYDENGETIATLAWFPMPDVKEKGQIKIGTFREQNAKLIASAPEMFEMLKELLIDIDELTIPTSMNNTIFRAEQLLTKITE